jgi:uncharacterized membrane protein YeaQ/YmgE (transglycosylase-associated protein family)
MRLAPSGVSRRLAFLLAASLLLGVLYRNVWVRDMEWKHDEQTMFEASQSSGAWSWVGMPSGVGLPNPGMSRWVFIALARLAGPRDPLALGHAVMVMNSIAVTLLLLFALRRAEEEERLAWLWAAALAAVNPGAVQLQRKIWAQSTLPLFSLAALYGWWNRHTRWGAFLWGAVGACLGQIHLSGFFFAAALALWTILFERSPITPRPRWRWWLLGSGVAAWPLVPWAAAVLTAPSSGLSGFDWRKSLRLEFWPHWLVDVTGLETARSLGRSGFIAWLEEPLWNGHRTFAVGLVLVIALGLVGAAIAAAVQSLWPRRRSWPDLLAGGSSTGRAQNAAFVGFGLLLTAAGIQIYPHYLIVAFPLTSLWLARAALQVPRGQRLLGGIWLAHALLAAAFLLHIHHYGGSPDGDYGASYVRQVTGR